MRDVDQLTDDLSERSSPAGDVPVIEGLRFTPTALEVPGNLSPEGWESALGRLVPLEQGASWWLGDLLVFGEKRYGETYEAALKTTGRSLQTLKNLAWVARRVKPAVRRADLPWRSHRVVAPLVEEEQVKWLAMAAEHGWTSDELGRELRAARSQGGAGGGEFPNPENRNLKPDYRCPECFHEWSGGPRPRKSC